MKYRFFWFLLVVIIGVSCSSKKETIDLMQRDFVMPVIIFPLGDDKIETTAITRKALELLGDFRNYDQLPDSITNDGYQLVVATPGDSTFMPPEVVLVTEDYLLMERDEIDMLASADRNIQILFFGTSNDLIQKHAAIAQFISAITKDHKVAIVDATSRQAYNHEAWQAVRTESLQKTPINVTDQIVLHSYRDGEFCRIVSLGMSKLGLPEVSVNNVPCSDTDAFGNIVNRVAQHFLDNHVMFADSTLQIDKVEIKLKTATLDEGNNFYPQLEIAFANQEEQMKVAEALFGSRPDLAENTDHDDELLLASELARERLPELKKMFNAGLPPGEAIMVKSPFKRDDVDGNEWMWVEVTKWTGTSMEGVLQNEPNHVSGINVGSVVPVTEAEIFDYIIMKADGTVEGNETGKIIERRSGNH